MPVTRLDLFLTEQLPELTRSQLKRLIEQEQILVDNQPAKVGEKLKGGETICVTFPAVRATEVVAQELPLQVLYEDPHLIVINKPAGLVVHPAPGHSEGTLVNALLHHCHDLAGIGGELRPGIVHRLDKDTSGVMMATKDDPSHLRLAEQFQVHSITRRYVALVHGLLGKDVGRVDCPIGRHPLERKKMSGKCRNGRRAVTHWQVLQRFPDDRLTLVELNLETGRTHQIRVHFAEMNFPLVGDPLYGKSSRIKELKDGELRTLLSSLGRQALHARILGFTHPISGDYMEFESPLPDDLQIILTYLHKKYRDNDA
ncbi:MAG: RluA family pseudouridine synthase [Desulfuromonadales bacterium]|nr:RluA family pseudouridine synthase [Desulfuromonadales bacterium]